jgi:hypothetical protein
MIFSLHAILPFDLGITGERTMEAMHKASQNGSMTCPEVDISKSGKLNIESMQFNSNSESLEAFNNLPAHAVITLLVETVLDVNQRDEVRILAASQLAVIGGEDAENALVDVLWRADDHPDVRSCTAMMLGKMGGQKVIDALESATKCVNPQVVKAVVQALQMNQAQKTRADEKPVDDPKKSVEYSIRWGQYLTIVIIGSVLLFILYQLL